MAILTDELVARAMAVQSVEELLALAEENDIRLSREEAEDAYAQICASLGKSPTQV